MRVDDFSFFHELAHIVLGHVGQMDGTTDQDETEADAWSSDTLISKEDFDDFVEEEVFRQLVYERLHRHLFFRFSFTCEN